MVRVFEFFVVKPMCKHKTANCFQNEKRLFVSFQQRDIITIFSFKRYGVR